jgi:mitochondrial fission protein ELM1
MIVKIKLVTKMQNTIPANISDITVVHKHDKHDISESSQESQFLCS